MRLIATAGLVLMCAIGGAAATPPAPAAAWLITSLDGTGARHERSDILETPVLPGSVAKIVTLIAALETGTVDAKTAHLCRRVSTINGQRYVCSHPDLKRPLTAAEALAYSCNDFFVSLARRLPRIAVDDVRVRVGMARIPPSADYPASLVGLDGPRTTPRRLLASFVRVIDPSRRDALKIATPIRAVLTDGLRGAARYGSASALGERGITALAKTGTAPMPGGGSFGIVLAAAPADRPSRAAVVIAPGAAGRDAEAIAAGLLIEGPAHAGRRDEGPAPGAAPLRIGRSDTVRRSPRDLPLEDYVAQVVAGEGQPDAAPAAQQALAIAARTFAVVNRGRHSHEGFDLCDTTHCQVTRAPTASSRTAAAATAGKVLTRNGRPVAVYYSAWCGGQSQVASNVWTDAGVPPGDRSRHDEACAHEPEWVSELSAPEVERALRSAGRSGDRLRELTIVQRDPSGRVGVFRAEGFHPAEISGEDFRLAVGRVIGWERLKSTLLQMNRTARGYQFRGRGMGHGVGLCVRGAGTRARRGASAEQILRAYYPELRVERVTAAQEASAGGRVLLALPAHEEDARREILTLVTQARDDVARHAGVTAPPELRVTVHPDVASFSRATGLPWWVAGATRGSSIHLLPVQTLRAQGQLARTVRHETAHAVLDSALRGKPMWVREGVTVTFSEPSRMSPPVASLVCPVDSEFLRTTSAAALRDAYLRAAACVRREIAAGTRWSEISASAIVEPAPLSPLPRRARSASR